jgi:hypothetical protein
MMMELGALVTRRTTGFFLLLFSYPEIRKISKTKQQQQRKKNQGELVPQVSLLCLVESASLCA